MEYIIIQILKKWMKNNILNKTTITINIKLLFYSYKNEET